MFNDFKIVNSFTLENSFFARYTEDERNEINQRIQKQIENESNKKKFLKQDSISTSCVESIHNEEDKSSKNIYDKVMGCHHFSNEDHIKLGEDLCHVLFKVYGSSLQKHKDKTQSTLNKMLK